MFDFALLLAQTGAVFLIMAWLLTGVYENLFMPELNRTFTTQVLDMERMRDQYPDAYADVAYRRISTPAIHKLLFRLIVTWETIAAVALVIGAAAMVLALFGAADPQTARGLAIIGALLFTSVWGGFLIAGNWFCYWFCHFEAQNTHYQMTLWGMATMILLAIG